MNELVIFASGLQTLWNNVLSGWIGPIFFAAVAIFAIIFIKDQAWRKLIGFIGIAAIVGVLIFAGPALFGQNSGLTQVAQDVASDVKYN